MSIVRDTHAEHSASMTTGERLAKLAGSWCFIIVFFILLFAWVIVNTMFFLTRPWDPYPFILLNLILSLLASIQVPVIMMSQNRQEARDRLRSEADYAINVKAEEEIAALHKKK